MLGAFGEMALVVLLATVCVEGQQQPARDDARDRVLEGRIVQLVDTFLTTDDDARSAAVLSEARTILEREGIPSVSRVGDEAAYGFVLINMLGQAPEIREAFFAELQKAAARAALPDDAVAFAEARQRQTAVEGRYRDVTPANPELRDEIARLLVADQAVREKEGFDLPKMMEADRKTAGALKAIFDRFGVPTFDMVGVQAARDFVVMVQHQPPEFRQMVLPKLKANLDVEQADPGEYASVYDRLQRDEGRHQLYGQQLECAAGKALEVAPIDDAANVNTRRAKLGLMRLELYARLVRLTSPDLCARSGK